VIKSLIMLALTTPTNERVFSFRLSRDSSIAATHKSRLIHFLIRQNYINLRSPFSGHRTVGPRATSSDRYFSKTTEGNPLGGIVSRQRSANGEINASETTGAPIRRSRKAARKQ